MQNGEIIPALIARIRQNNTNNIIIRNKLYSLHFKLRHNGK